MRLPEEFSALEDREGWYQSPPGPWQVLERRALQLQEMIPLPMQIICGWVNGEVGHGLYAIEDIEPAELIEQFAVGSHALYSYGSDDSEQCFEEMQAIYRIAAYRPYFVDAAGFKSRFLQPITPEIAHKIEDILTVGLEAYQSEWSGEGPVVANTLVKENQVRLWWD